MIVTSREDLKCCLDIFAVLKISSGLNLQLHKGGCGAILEFAAAMSNSVEKKGCNTLSLFGH
jgi:hypothetical protein